MTAFATKVLFHNRLVHLLNREPGPARAATMMEVAHLMASAGALSVAPVMHSPRAFAESVIRDNPGIDALLREAEPLQIRVASTAEDLVARVLPPEAAAA